MAKEFAMTHADIDPSLCTGEPTLESLDDGFSPPARDAADAGAGAARQETPAEPELSLSTKSPF
jgi:hypothetical protein